ncbi:MAG: hypothetical protein CMP11_03075 [Zetaproteobacteria bacterium]|nr:hypothetical protein [Pseudobdellovibrionaceae bacterium]|tara:strand:- start:1055 stop:1495 length:441 start_codon:yes stop_codon:yes gene_type:complete
MQKETDTKKGTVRITIHPKDLRESLGDDFKDTVKNWIEKGKRNDILDQKIDTLEKKTSEKIEKISSQLESISYLLACLTDQMLSSLTNEQYKIEVLKHKEKTGLSLTKEEKNILGLHKIRFENWDKLKHLLEICIDTSELTKTRRD